MSAATQDEMERLVRINREQQALLDQIYQYVDEQGLAKLGQSRVSAMIEAHRNLVAERDTLAAHVVRWKEWLGRDPEDDAGDWMDEGWAIAKARGES